VGPVCGFGFLGDIGQFLESKTPIQLLYFHLRSSIDRMKIDFSRSFGLVPQEVSGSSGGLLLDVMQIGCYEMPDFMEAVVSSDLSPFA
jgi:hypothetical protein